MPPLRCWLDLMEKVQQEGSNKKVVRRNSFLSLESGHMGFASSERGLLTFRRKELWHPISWYQWLCHPFHCKSTLNSFATTTMWESQDNEKEWWKKRLRLETGCKVKINGNLPRRMCQHLLQNTFDALRNATKTIFFSKPLAAKSNFLAKRVDRLIICLARMRGRLAILRGISYSFCWRRKIYHSGAGICQKERKSRHLHSVFVFQHRVKSGK